VARILILDDDPVFRGALAATLMELGYEVREADTGRGVEDIVCRERIDLVVTEICMPERDGLEVILALRRALPKVPVVAVREEREDGQYLLLARTFGAKAALQKSVPMLTIIETIRTLLEISKKESDAKS
jgi:DNA-binding NarL/FixJ family response regulator